jgi:hypothetical protein
MPALPVKRKVPEPSHRRVAAAICASAVFTMLHYSFIERSPFQAFEKGHATQNIVFEDALSS